MKKRSIGIDLGTRNALTAYLDDSGAVKLIPNRWGNTVTHSVVGLAENGWVIGEDAVKLGLSGSPNVWWDLKRHVGTDFRVMRLVPENKGNTRGVNYTAQELLVPLLEGLREDAEAYLKTFISSCVLAVPAGFTVKQREVMMRAAARAGMSDVRIIAEPTAAALAFGRPGRFLVLDFGAGTVDLSVVESEIETGAASENGGVWQVLESMGTDTIGGYEFDVALAEWLRECLLLDPMTHGDPRWTVLIQEAEKIKIALSDCWAYHWNPPRLGNWNPPDLTIYREDLERLMRFQIRRLVHTVRRLWKRYEPDHLLMVGGSSRIPLLQETLEREVALPERLSLCADDAVVRGATLYTEHGRERLLLDALSGDLVAVWEGRSHTLVPSESTLPAHAEVNLRAEDEGRAKLELMQSQNEMRQESVNLASVELNVRSGEKVLLTCDLSASGLLDAALHREDNTLVRVPLALALGSPDSDTWTQEQDTVLAANRRLDELKLSLVGLEPFLSNQQRDRLQLIFSRTEAYVSEPEILTLLEGLVRDVKQVVRAEAGARN